MLASDLLRYRCPSFLMTVLRHVIEFVAEDRDVVILLVVPWEGGGTLSVEGSRERVLLSILC